jgi:hypothetical protein
MSGPRIGGDDDDDSFRNIFSCRINIIAVGFHWHVRVRSFIHSFIHSLTLLTHFRVFGNVIVTTAPTNWDRIKNGVRVCIVIVVQQVYDFCNIIFCTICHPECTVSIFGGMM